MEKTNVEPSTQHGIAADRINAFTPSGSPLDQAADFERFEPLERFELPFLFIPVM
ncbi:MAG TPA: hypothetical protein VEG60_14270 [Candidatus Binatia bacterium]|nr:hypothetical protein [Candidatus Binatia bacterium]